MTEYRPFDVALSFAGEDRPYVSRLAYALKERGVAVFYDLFEEADLWGKDLYVHLSDVYSKKAKFTIMFISKYYAQKLWTNHERKSAQARAFQESIEYILPARFDDTEIPGVLPTTGYVSLIGREPDDFALLVVKKLVGSGVSVPSEVVRRSYGTLQSVPRPDPTELTIRLKDDDRRPIIGARVLAVAENGTTLTSSSDLYGNAVFKIYTLRKYTILIAHDLYPAMVIDLIDPSEDADVMIPRSDNVGSTIINGLGQIPGLSGNLNPIKDELNRMYMHVDNVAIDGKEGNTFFFQIGHTFEMEDCDGNFATVTVKYMAGRNCLLQYIKPNTIRS